MAEVIEKKGKIGGPPLCRRFGSSPHGGRDCRAAAAVFAVMHGRALGVPA
jgi:hypothetical protein